MVNTVLAREKMSETNKIWQDVIDALTDPTAGMDEEESARYLSKIIAKLKSGKKLSADELDYLRMHEPQLYMTAIRVQQRREALMHRLKNCRSKQEAQDVIDNEMGGVSKDDSDKEYIVAAIKEVEKEFKSSKFYKKLPDKKEDTERRKLLKYLSGNNFEEDTENEYDFMNDNVTPIAELLDVLPVFEAKA